MSSNSIVGVRYIGKKERQEDTVCKTGAVWTQGQVHNFGDALAKALLVHTDSFERAPVAVDGGTYLSRGKKPAAQDVAAFVNLTAMGIDQMILLARTEFNRVVNPEGKDEAQVRREVHALMTNHSIDMEAERLQTKTKDGKVMIPYMATPEEAEALKDGVVVLAIIPAEVVNAAPAVLSEPKQDKAGPDGDTPSLSNLLASLGKKDLIAFAKQESVAISNTMTEEKLREKIFTELSVRQGTE